MKPLVIYGANGYTGALIVEEAVRCGLRPIIAGRSSDKLEPLARAHGLEMVAFALHDFAAVRAVVACAGAVLHAAGPYAETGTAMIDACLALGVDYLDLCGEIDVLEALQARDAEAKARNVMLLPGAGFDVVPSDCLVAHLRQRLPSLSGVRLFIGGMSQLSRGSLRTLVRGIARGAMVRRGGRLVELDSPAYARCDFGEGPRSVVGIGLGDVSTAWWSCRVPDIEVFFESSPELERQASMPAWQRRLLGTPAGQWLLRRQIERRPLGPSAESRNRGHTRLVGEARDAAGGTARSLLKTPEAYQLSAMTAVEIAQRVLAGDRRPGLQTASMLFGADFILSFPGVTREDASGTGVESARTWSSAA
jgi:short subunit dehydrogenase-like uncharacterized protein